MIATTDFGRINFWSFQQYESGFWHVFPYLVTYPILLSCMAVMLYRLYRHISLWWKVGRPEKRWDQIGTRIGRVIQYGIVQAKVLRQSYPGIMHVAMAWGFFVFAIGTALATVDADTPFKILQGNVYLLYKVVLDIFTVIALVGIAMAAYRRFVLRPERLSLDRPFAIMLTAVFSIVLTGLLIESLRLAGVAIDPTLQPGWKTAYGWWMPVGTIVSKVWLGLSLGVPAIQKLSMAMWILHAALVGWLLVTLPNTRFLHMLTTLGNVFFSKLDRPVGQLAPAFQKEGGLAGAATLKDFTWKQLMDGDACTECGRCQDACPAHAAGTPLSPKKLILAIKNGLARQGAALVGGNGDQPPAFTGEFENAQDAAVWACTTCGSCVEECPVLIEHVDTIVDMRRALLSEQRADDQLMTALASFRRYGNSFGKSDRQRALWIKGMDFKPTDIRKKPAKTLWFVGDYASYSPTLTEVTRATARVFNQIGLDWGILYDGERNAGNDVRRIGEEGLFEMLAMKNKAVLDKCEYEEIVTTDPHTYNTLKNEYDLNGKAQSVLHYAELFDRLIAQGKLPIKRKLNCTVTYHDPCYLGRYNGIYDAPRRVLEALGCRIVEMPRNRDRSFCCGAGGGRINMDDEGIQDRPSESRIREAVALDGVQYFVVACPKDVTMYRDAVKTTGCEDRIEVKDLIELVEEAIREEAPAEPVAEAAAAPQG